MITMVTRGTIPQGGRDTMVAIFQQCFVPLGSATSHLGDIKPTTSLRLSFSMRLYPTADTNPMF